MDVHLLVNNEIFATFMEDQSHSEEYNEDKYFNEEEQIGKKMFTKIVFWLLDIALKWVEQWEKCNYAQVLSIKYINI